MDSRSTSELGMFPGFNKLYDFGGTEKIGIFRAELLLSDDPLKLKRAEIRPTEPVLSKWFMGRSKPTELIWTGEDLPLFEKRTIDLFVEVGLTGWLTFPVDLRGKSGERIENYRGMMITGRCGPLQYDKSVPFFKKYPARISEIRRGLFFDPDSWDGSDFFMPEGTNGFLFTTEKVKSVLLKLKISNAIFTPLAKMELPWLP